MSTRQIKAKSDGWLKINANSILETFGQNAISYLHKKVAYLVTKKVAYFVTHTVDRVRVTVHSILEHAADPRMYRI